MEDNNNPNYDNTMVYNITAREVNTVEKSWPL